jgi:hypothetical protein
MLVIVAASGQHCSLLALRPKAELALDISVIRAHLNRYRCEHRRGEHERENQEIPRGEPPTGAVEVEHRRQRPSA